MAKGTDRGMCACHSQLIEDRILRSKQGFGGDAAYARCVAAFHLQEEGDSLHPRSQTSIHKSKRLQLTPSRNTVNTCGLHRGSYSGEF